jgi:hypothetical protein
MFFEQRPILIRDVAPGGTLAAVARDLSRDGVTFTLCTAYRLPGGDVIVNDATSEDGAGEWAVLRPNADGATYRQIDSVTFGWMPATRVLAYLTADRPDDGWSALAWAQSVRLHPHPEGACPLCQ